MVNSPRPVAAPGLTLAASPLQMQTASLVAMLRHKAANAWRKEHQSLGSEAENIAADFAGVLSELLLIDTLERAGLQPKGYCLFHDRPPSGPDFRLGPLRFSIKSVRPGKQFVCLNEKQRLDPRFAFDYLLPVRFIRQDTARMLRPVPACEVAAWPLREDRHSPYRSIAVAELCPLASIEELLP